MASRSIADLHPIFQPMVKKLLSQGQEVIKDTGFTFFITDGYRSFDEQTALYAQGRTKPGNIVTNAKAGESAHDYGLAVDCAFQKDGKLYYTQSHYDKVYPIAKGLGFVLGAEWDSFQDRPHFEYPNWRKYVALTQKEIPMDQTIPVKKEDFETLVTKSTRYDELVKIGIATASDVEDMRRREEDAKNACSTAQEEAKNTRDSLAQYKQKIAEKLNSPQDLDRVLSAIEEMIKQSDTATANDKKSREQIVEDEKLITSLKAEVARLELLLKQKQPLNVFTTTELFEEFFRRIRELMQRRSL